MKKKCLCLQRESRPLCTSPQTNSRNKEAINRVKRNKTYKLNSVYILIEQISRTTTSVIFIAVVYSHRLEGWGQRDITQGVQWNICCRQDVLFCVCVSLSLSHCILFFSSQTVPSKAVLIPLNKIRPSWIF